MYDQFCLITSHSYPESYGGEETFLKRFSKYLGARGIEYTILSVSSKTDTNVVPVGILPFSVPTVGFEVFSIIFMFLATLKMLQINRKKRICLIYSVETGYAGVAAVAAGRLLRVPVVVHSHTKRSDLFRRLLDATHDPRTWLYYAWERTIDTFVGRRATLAFAVSEDVSNFLKSLGVPPSRIASAPSAIDIERFSVGDRIECRCNLGIPTSAFVIGYVGRLERLKGVNLLLEAFVRFQEESESSGYLIIVGDGSYGQRLRENARRLSAKNVSFVGYQSDIVPYLKSMDVFVLASTLEGSPVSLLEAMAAAVPIVTTRLPSILEVVDDDALTIPLGDVESLAGALFQLWHNAGLRQKLAFDALQRAKALFSEEMIFGEILRRCLDTASRPEPASIRLRLTALRSLAE